MKLLIQRIKKFKSFEGLCNGTLLICNDFKPHVISATISSGDFKIHIYFNMAQRYTINMITPTLKIGPQKVQVVDKSRPRDNKDKTTKYQVLVLQDEEMYLPLSLMVVLQQRPRIENEFKSLFSWTSRRTRRIDSIKTIETKLVAYKMKSTTPIGSIMLIPFEDEVISVANIQAQPPGQVFNVEAELSLASKDQRFSVLACSNCKQLFTRYNVQGKSNCTSCHQSTHLIPRENVAPHFKETLSLQNVEDQLNGKIFNIQMKRLFTKRMDATQKLFILSYLEKEDLEHFCCGSRNGHFLHSFAAAIECRVLQASDVPMWMPSSSSFVEIENIFSRDS
ncbi:hypothetical protein H5410_049862, partial [Solanum commersonii]